MRGAVDIDALVGVFTATQEAGGTLRACLAAVAEMVAAPAPSPEVAAVIALVVAEFHVTEAELRGRSRMRRVTLPRGVVWHLLYRGGMSYPEIGRLFDRDHTTIICGCQTVDERMDVDDVFRGRFAKLKREIWAQGKAA